MNTGLLPGERSGCFFGDDVDVTVVRPGAGTLWTVVLRFGSGDLVATGEPVFREAVFTGVRATGMPGDTRRVFKLSVADCLGREEVTVDGGAAGVLIFADGVTGGGVVAVAVSTAGVDGTNAGRAGLPRR